ncbi:MAG: DUF423 domain-containing protein [Bacteroidetes bacterium]|nr:DUF423 domain-containing protein [Bacteroidota bacterium]
MNRKIVITAALFGLLAVVAGAFGAHSLKARLSLSDIDIWHTAVQYQFYHVFALLFLGLYTNAKASLVNLSYYLFTSGIICFSGSLYLIAAEDLFGWRLAHIIWPVTPLGGVFFIGGWAALILAAIRNKE